MWWEVKDFLCKPKGPVLVLTHRVAGLQGKVPPSQTEGEGLLLVLFLSLSCPAVLRPSNYLMRAWGDLTDESKHNRFKSEMSPLILSVFRHGITPPGQPLPDAFSRHATLPRKLGMVLSWLFLTLPSSPSVTGPTDSRRGYHISIRTQWPSPEQPHSSGLSQRSRQGATCAFFPPKKVF